MFLLEKNLSSFKHYENGTSAKQNKENKLYVSRGCDHTKLSRSKLAWKRRSFVYKPSGKNPKAQNQQKPQTTPGTPRKNVNLPKEKQDTFFLS